MEQLSFLFVDDLGILLLVVFKSKKEGLDFIFRFEFSLCHDLPILYHLVKDSFSIHPFLSWQSLLFPLQIFIEKLHLKQIFKEGEIDTSFF